MRAYDIIYKKREGGTLTEEEINFFVQGFTRGEIPDYQASAFLMAVFLKGMSARETAILTRTMAESGGRLDLSAVRGVKVDKHSTGGVGDGISLVLAPLAAACGAKVPMMSGRGLGHTGGTLDKLQSIPGFRVELGAEETLAALSQAGAAMIGQSPALAPADRRLYALRDVTATVESIPLITASILSKKIAEGTEALVMDVKTGNGAFMAEKKQAVALARMILEVGKRSRLNMAAVVSEMSEPLGWAVGNALEVKQAVAILKGVEDPRTRGFIDLTEILGGWMLFLSKLARSSKEGRERIRQARRDGSGLAKFREIVRLQGGDPAVAERPDEILPASPLRRNVLSPWKGFISAMQARPVGLAAMRLGAGRDTQESRIDPAAGIVLLKKTGERVERGEALAEFHFAREELFGPAEKMFLAALKIGKGRAKGGPLIHKILR